MDQRYGTEVWNGSFKEVWNGGMERVWSRSLFRTSYFDLLPVGLIIPNIWKQLNSCSKPQISVCLTRMKPPATFTVSVCSRSWT